MKRLHRRMTPLLSKQLKEQEKRIKACVMYANLNYYHPIQIETGTYWSKRFKS